MDSKFKNYRLVDTIKVSSLKETKINLLDKEKFDSYILLDSEKNKVDIKKDKTKIIFTPTKKGEYYLYGRNYKKMLMSLIIGLLIVGVFSYATTEDGETAIINLLKLDTPTKAEIKSSNINDMWGKEAIISINKDSKSYSGIDYYEYCIRDDKDFDKCEWKRTNSKNVIVSNNGEHNVVFRGVSNNGKPGKISDVIVVKIDNESPELSFEISDNKLKINANDKYSGLQSYWYKIDDGKYQKADKEIDLDELKDHKVTIKVVDNAGNSSEIQFELDKDGNIKTNTNPDTHGKESDNKKGSSDNSENNDSKKESDNKKGEKSSTDDDSKKEEEDTNPDKKIIPVPKINMDDIPSSILYGSSYEIPSELDFMGGEGNATCLVGDRVITNTNQLEVGNNLITCTAKGNNGISTTVNKNVNVYLNEAADETFDGWIILNLHYPEKSTNWEWRLGGNNTIRTGKGNDSWQTYTGPIKVKLSDVDNIYLRYQLNGETIIQAPANQVLLDIEPENFTIKENETTRVKIVYDSNAQTKQYRINAGLWQDYNGEFEVGPNTLIEARVIKSEPFYDEDGNYLYDKKKQNKDSVLISQLDEEKSIERDTTVIKDNTISLDDGNTITYSDEGEVVNIEGKTDQFINGATLSQDTTGIVEKTILTITPEYEASEIYYSINDGPWQLYTEPVEIDENCDVKSYYVRKEDGNQSEYSYIKIDNIKPKNLPYVKINVIPTDYLGKDVESATVSITGSDYTKLEYSFDGDLYIPYTNSFTVNKTTYVYARGTNNNGENVVYTYISTTTKPSKKKNLSVSISLEPEKEESFGLANKTIATIDYDQNATKKYYKINLYGDLLEYNGPITITENSTIYAYALSENGKGSTSKIVDFLVNGIAEPIIKVVDDSSLIQKQIEITYDDKSINNTYKINNSDEMTYTGSFNIYETSKITATNTDELGNTKSVTKTIYMSNYPRYSVLDRGDYYIVTLNYPANVNSSSWEYKWQDDGDWTHYEDHGILLIKSTAASMIGADGVRINENGREIHYKKDYYVVDKVNDELLEHLYMRWDKNKPDTPTFSKSTDDPDKSVTVAINYDNNSTEKYYKIVNNNSDQNWLEYNGPFELTENSTVYAYSINDLKVESDHASYTVKNIDNVPPTVTGKWDSKKKKRYVNVTIVGSDKNGIDKVAYAKGSHDENYFKENEIEFLPNYSEFTVNENGTYTLVAVDSVGNYGLKEIEITNVDLNAPNINIKNLTKELSSEVLIEIDYDDAVVKKYSIGNNTSYQDYTKKFKVSALDYKDLKNEDGSLTIYAKGIDGAGNESEEVSEDIYNLDFDIPATPIINKGTGLLIYSKKGVSLDDGLTIEYDATRDDLKNEVSYNNGLSWEYYQGFKHVKEALLKARSTKISTGLVVQTSEIIAEPQDYLGMDVFDRNQTTGQDVAQNSKVSFLVDETIYDNALSVYLDSNPQSNATLKIYSKNNTELGTYVISSAETEVDIPNNSYKVEITTGDSPIKINEIEVILGYRKVRGESILSILQNNDLKTGYYTFALDSNENYNVHLYNYKNNLTISDNTTYGDATDLATATSQAQNMVIVKVNGDLTINQNVTVGPAYNEYGGPKGFTLFVTGKLTNNGTIDNSHGAYAQNQDVFLWKNANNSFETVPGEGATGGESVSGKSNGNKGNDGTARQTGGGGSGDSYNYWGSNSRASGAGGRGTSYSGGSGGGGTSTTKSDNELGTAGSSIGGEGGLGGAGEQHYSIGGAGNPGGTGAYNKKVGGNDAYKGADGTGGLLIIYANEYQNNGLLKAAGTKNVVPVSKHNISIGGSSGGGSINIFTNQSTNIESTSVNINEKYISMLGNYDISGGAKNDPAGTEDGNKYYGGAGGDGTINIGEIRNGTYYDLKDVIQQDLDEYIASFTKTGDSIISILKDNTFVNGEKYYNFVVNGTSKQTYTAHVYNYDSNLTLSSNTTYGNINDISKIIPATATSEEYRDYAQNMVILRVEGNLTINSNVTVGPFYNELGGPKGFLIYVTGKLINNGTIDNSHGAYAQSQDVFLWKNANNSFELVPGEGATGGESVSGKSNGNKGNDGTARQTGGGGSGDSYNYWSDSKLSGAGGRGTSYSGGTGGGPTASKVESQRGTNGSSEGGEGGLGGAGESHYAIGGAGNPGGTGAYNQKVGGNEAYKGSDGTGGLLIIYANEYQNNGLLKAAGTKNVVPVSKHNISIGGSSGGGSINIFTNQSTNIESTSVNINEKYVSMLGNIDVSGGEKNDANGTTNGHKYYGGAGGDGTVNIGEIRNGTYYDLKTVIQQDLDSYIASFTKTGDSIISILKDNTFKNGEGYYNFVVNGTSKQTYTAHVYNYNSNLTLSSNTTYGDINDISKIIPATATSGEYRDYAQNMVVVKVNGNLTINSNVTVGPFYNELGGPKGFLIYVTGKLINNGTIDNSHGAYAKNQDVFLWKNANGTFETVSGQGALGGEGVTGKSNGNKGNDGTARQTGGGGSGDGYNYWDKVKLSGAGGRGTSYSGGTGGGPTASKVESQRGTDGSSEGGEGGLGGAGESHYAIGGTGNPGGTGAYNKKVGGNDAYKGSDGTGGLLIIYANEYQNSGLLKAAGTKNVNPTTKSYVGIGGSSGGGSINVFTNQNTNITSTSVNIDSKYDSILGNTDVSGGEKNDANGTSNGHKYYGGAGGNGTINIGEIRNGTYYDLKTIIQQDITSFTNGTNNSTNSLLSSPKSIRSTAPVNTEIMQTVDNPEIIFKDNQISINYPKGVYVNEYSLDFGETWINYTEPIEVNNSTIIFTRVTENDNVVAASSYIIEKEVDEDNIKFEVLIPEEVQEGEKVEYTFGTDYVGGDITCLIDDKYEETTPLKEGKHVVKCNLKTKTGKIITSEKEFMVVKSQEVTPSSSEEEGEKNED